MAPYETVTVHTMVSESAAPLLIAENTVRQSIVPAEEALKMPASVRAAVAVPAGKVAVYAMLLVVTTADVFATRPDSVTSVVWPIAAAVVPMPTAM